MNRKKLDTLWKEIEAARRNSRTGSALEELAKAAGRHERKGGNHPMWVSHFPQNRAFPISRHGGDPIIGSYVKKVILEHIENDAACWEEKLEKEENDVSDEG